MKSEERIQQEIIMEFNNTYKTYRGLLCYNLNNSIGGYRGRVNKFLGLVKGRSDLVFYWNGSAYHIELKTATGQQKPEQKDWQALVERYGFKYYIIRSSEDGMKLIASIIKNHPL
tara:strand:- start:1668 stop:2012 length:345 start_codon:yes stop_codon:yes gene_type:complete